LKCNIFPFSAETISTAQPTIQPDWYDYFIGAFAMSRGGMRLKALSLNNDAALVRTSLYLRNLSGTPITQRCFTGSPAVYTNFSATSFNTVPSQYFKQDKNAVEVAVPQYHRLHSRVNSELMTGVGLGTTYSSSNLSGSAPTIFVNFQKQSGTGWSSSSTTTFRSVSDDFQMGYFIGVPPMRPSDN